MCIAGGYMKITTDTVKKLINTQFPEYQDLDIKMVNKSGHDNRTFHLGSNMLVRLPSAACYQPQVIKEGKWLKYLSQNLSLPITTQVALGQPSSLYPFYWSINNYIDGKPLNQVTEICQNRLARDLAKFLSEFQSIDPTGGPKPGAHNFERGGSLKFYEQQTLDHLLLLKDHLPCDKLKVIWDTAVSSSYQKDPVWVHGDIAAGNLLTDGSKLSAVIDFGILAVGDPACDYVMAWTYFEPEAREIFLDQIDSETIKRAKGWALWKALITVNDQDSEVSNLAKRTINQLLLEK